MSCDHEWEEAFWGNGTPTGLDKCKICATTRRTAMTRDMCEYSCQNQCQASCQSICEVTCETTCENACQSMDQQQGYWATDEGPPPPLLGSVDLIKKRREELLQIREAVDSETALRRRVLELERRLAKAEKKANIKPLSTKNTRNIKLGEEDE